MTRLLNIVRTRRVAEDIDEEMRFHLDSRVTDNMAAGLTEHEARQDATRRFGSRLFAREATRDVAMLVALDTLLQDVRYVARGLRRNAGVTAVIVFSLALSIGAATAIFSLVEAIVLRPLPYRDPGRLVMAWSTNTLNGAAQQNTSVLNADDWRTRARTFATMALYREADAPLVRPDTPSVPTEWIEYAWVSGSFFDALGRAAAVGRVIDSNDVTLSRRVTVLSDKLWRQSFGSSQDALGSIVNVGGLDVEVIGVMPGDFWFPSKDAALWVPASLNPRWQAAGADRRTRFGAVLGRLASDATLERARAEMSRIAAQLRQDHPDANADLGVRLVPLQVQVNGTSVPFMLTLLSGAVLCVLLIACANVTNVLLSRGLARRREIALRSALGAARYRIVRQLLTESVLVSGLGGVAGLVLARWIMQGVTRLAPKDIPRLDDVHINLFVALFAVALSVGAGLLSGLMPALQLARRGSNEAAHLASRTPAGGQTGLALRGALVACQFALGVVLLAGAGLFLRSLVAAGSVDAGFRSRDVVTAHVRFHNTLPRASRAARYQEAMARLGRIPGVHAAGAVSTMFWDGDGGQFGLRAVEGGTQESRSQWTALGWSTVSGDYFNAIGVPLVRGRFFDSRDQHDSPPVALVNETMARRFWPSEDPLGKRFKGFDARGAHDDWVTVIGVVKDVRSRGIERQAMAQIFETQRQSLEETENVVVWAAFRAGIGDVLRATIRDLDPTAVVLDVAALDQVIADQTARRRFETYLLSSFAALALVLAAGGIFGTMHYSVVQRTQELGVRIALGADRGQILGMIVRQGAAWAAIGMSLGLAGSLALSRTMASLLFGVTPQDPPTLVATCVTLAALALAGCLLPALRATRIDPLLTLRSE